MSNDIVLEVNRIGKRFDGVSAITDLSFGVKSGVPTALIGPNGAGKTTAFNLITGVYPLDTGKVVVNGKDITNLPSRQRITAGIARSFQNIRLVSHLTAVENVLLGQQSRMLGLYASFQLVGEFTGRKPRDEARAALAAAGLGDYANDTVATLPYGVQKQIELVRAVIARPSVLLLDEPAAGLNKEETDRLRSQLERLFDDHKITLLIIEHDMHFIFSLCQRLVVLNFGSKIAEGSPSDIRRNPLVQEIYLGRCNSDPAAAGTAKAEKSHVA